MDYFSLLYDLWLAAHRFPLEMTLERDVINKLEHIIDSTSTDAMSCSAYALKLASSVSDIVRENIWSVHAHQWQLEGFFNSSDDYYYFLRRLAVTSDKKSMAGALSHPPRIFFPDAVTRKTVDGPFKIPTDVIGPDLLYSLIFSPDDKFLFLDDLTNGFLLNKDVL